MFRRSLGAAACILALAGDAHASYSVSARTEVELYDLPSVAGADHPYALPQQRLVQYLRLGAYDLGSRGPGERIDFQASLRLDQNFGLTTVERRALGIVQPQLDLLYGYLQWTGGLHGLLDLRLGRQLELRDMTPWGLDGLAVTVHPPVHLAVTAFGGFLVTGTSPLGFSTLAPDGVRQSDSLRLAANPTAGLLTDPAGDAAYAWDDAPQAVFGGRLDLEGVPDLALGLSYRQAQSRTSGNGVMDLPRGAQGYQVTVQRLGATGSYSPLRRLEIYGAGDVDVFLRRMAGVRAGTRVEVIPYRATVVAEWSYLHPSFSADSIFNLFSTGAHQDLQVRAEVAPRGPWTYRAGLLASGVRDNAGVGERPGAWTFVPGGFAGVNTKPGRRYRAGADVFYLGNPGARASDGPSYLGQELWVTLSGGLDLVPGAYAADLRLSAAKVSDPYAPALRGFWSQDATLISRSRLTRVAELLVMAEASTNAYSKLDLRAYAALEVEAAFR